jgi:hypothetical protein
MEIDYWRNSEKILSSPILRERGNVACIEA